MAESLADTHPGIHGIYAFLLPHILVNVPTTVPTTPYETLVEKKHGHRLSLKKYQIHLGNITSLLIWIPRLPVIALIRARHTHIRIPGRTDKFYLLGVLLMFKYRYYTTT